MLIFMSFLKNGLQLILYLKQTCKYYYLKADMDYKHIANGHNCSWKSKPKKSLARVFLMLVGILIPIIAIELIFATQAHAAIFSLKLPHRDAPQISKTQVKNTKPIQQAINHIIKPSDSLYRLFKAWQVKPGELPAIIQNKQAKQVLTNLQPGKRLVVKLTPQQEIDSIDYEISPLKSLQIRRKKGQFTSKVLKHKHNIQLERSTSVIKNSFYAAAKRSKLPDRLIMELAEIFAWEVNFAHGIQPGDRFNILYEAYYRGDTRIATGEIVAAEINTGGKSYYAIRHIDVQGNKHYYTEKGKSLQKMFLRNPVKYKRISSYFRLSRKHPVLHFIRAHKGVDFAAAKGTAIKASADGKIIYLGRKGTYGKTIIIRHNRKYKTLYAHLSGYKRKLRVGSRVKQGQVIAYVGSTGLATGPHLHYEFLVYNKHKDPLKQKFPRTPAITKQERPAFLAQAKTLMNQLHSVQYAALEP